MNASVPLSAASRSLLELGSEVPAPSAEQAERMRLALQPLLAAQTPPASHPASEGALRGVANLRGTAAARNWATRGKLLCTLGALATTASASFWLGRMSSAAPSAPPVSLPVLVAPQQSLPEAPFNRELLDREPLATVTTAAPTPVRASPSPHNRTGGRGKRTLGLAAEIEQLTAVEAALRQGRADAALRQLTGATIHELVEQSSALRAIAECSLGRRHADQKARAHLARWPESAYQTRVRDACGL